MSGVTDTTPPHYYGSTISWHYSNKQKLFIYSMFTYLMWVKVTIPYHRYISQLTDFV